MNPRYLLFAGLISSSTAPISHAAVYPYAEYHLGETGSLNGVDLKPQDSSGLNRHFLGGHFGSNYATVSSSVSTTAIGSTASLDTTMAGDQYWTGSGMSFSTLPTNNFAFGIFARCPDFAPGYQPVF